MNKKKDSLDQHQEWQDQQFNPGYFTGGNIPGWLHKPGNKVSLGIALILIGFMISVWGFFYFWSDGLETDAIIVFALTDVFAIFLILGGFKVLRKN